MDQPATFALSAIAIGQIALSVSILSARSVGKQAYFPLIAFFISLAILISGPLVAMFAADYLSVRLLICLPAFLLLGPTLWLYVKALTSEIEWRLEKKDAWHLTPVLIGFVCMCVLMLLPDEAKNELLLVGNDHALDNIDPIQQNVALSALTVAFILILTWVLSTAGYLFHSIRRLSIYRARLKDLFASNETRELTWLIWLVSVLGLMWLIVITTIITDNFFGFKPVSTATGYTMLLATIWTLSIWGVRQKPGFEGRYLSVSISELTEAPPIDDSDNQTETDSPHQGDPQPKPKYERSALGEEQATRIAQKINSAMQEEQLYLDSSLSLQKLSSHLRVSPNYISQTLNETLDTTFFDCVNNWRIEAAKPKIILGESSVLDIAMEVGFNSRSSFYTAFKKQTGQTPSQYRTSRT